MYLVAYEVVADPCLGLEGQMSPKLLQIFINVLQIYQFYKFVSQKVIYLSPKILFVSLFNSFLVLPPK
jgi:hypothetical protein